MRIVLLCALLACAAIAFSAEATIVEALAGKGYPLTLKLGSLDGAWTQMNVDVSTNATADQLMRTFAMMSGSMPSGSLSFTKGEVFTFGGETFLVTYQLPQPKMNLQEMMREGEPPAPATLTPDTPVTLSLLNLRMIAGLRDIQPFALTHLPNNTVEVQAPLSAQEQSVQNVRQLLTAIMIYCQDHDETLPDAADVWNMISVEKAVLLHPATKEPYQYNPALSGRALGTITDPEATVAVYEARPDAEGKRVVGYMDGHVVVVDEAAFTKQLAANTFVNETEQQLQQALETLRVALALFHQDMGVYPNTLKDLLAADAKELTPGYTRVKSFHGPYLNMHPGIATVGITGVPANPLVTQNTVGYATLATHWNYNAKTGEIHSRVTGNTDTGDTRWEDL